jgi:DNA-binding transcriptional regulator YdaS (Cro superfamily)
VSAAFVSQLASGARPIPPHIAIAIERETAGAVTVEELRPDMDWAVIRARPAAATREAA